MLTARTTEERQEQETYQRLLAHLDRCDPCQEWADCEEGERIRRALRAARIAAHHTGGGGSAESGAAVNGAEPGPTLVPCASCLRQLLTADPAEPHACSSIALLGIERGPGLADPEVERSDCFFFPEDGWCPCPCQQQHFEESPALRAARAAARDLSAHAHRLAEPPREE